MSVVDDTLALAFAFALPLPNAHFIWYCARLSIHHNKYRNKNQMCI